ncbi:MAG: MFS transporter [Defluviitaleaceae bacterium]|nr:MFS transporter [Defluviitaleaceae bacterium]
MHTRPNDKIMYFGTAKDIKRNMILYFLDGVSFPPSMALISMATVIPFFLEQLNASTFQVAIAATLVLVCGFIAQPVFGSIATRTRVLSQTFGKILLLQRIIFLAFVLSIPLFAHNPALLIWLFLFFWGVFNIFAGSGTVFNVPLILKLLPPDKRAGMRGVGFAIGNTIGVGMTALIPVILGGIAFPYNFVIIFSLGLSFLFLNAIGFLLMREHEDVEPREPMGVLEFIKGIPGCVEADAAFRAMIIMCMFLLVAISLIPFYTLYAIRIFMATEYQVAILATLAVVTNAFGNIIFGFLIDRKGPQIAATLCAYFVIISGALALFANSLFILYGAWVLIHLGSSCYMKTATLLLGDVSPPGKSPLYVGVLMTITMATSSIVVLLLAPLLENVGFVLLFMIVFGCGAAGLMVNLFLFKKQLARRVELDIKNTSI